MDRKVLVIIMLELVLLPLLFKCLLIIQGLIFFMKEDL